MNARERRAAELAANADKQAELKREAAERRAIRAARGEGKGPAKAGRGKSARKPSQLS